MFESGVTIVSVSNKKMQAELIDLALVKAVFCNQHLNLSMTSRKAELIWRRPE